MFEILLSGETSVFKFGVADIYEQAGFNPGGVEIRFLYQHGWAGWTG
jgi:hypothetical protein